MGQGPPSTPDHRRKGGITAEERGPVEEDVSRQRTSRSLRGHSSTHHPLAFAGQDAAGITNAVSITSHVYPKR